MIHLLEQYWAAEVPEGASGFNINCYHAGSELNYWRTDEGKQRLIVKDLPPGTWQIVCTSKDRNIPNGVVECKTIEYDGQVQGTRFVNYLTDNQRRWFINKTDSLRTLLASKGCDLNKNYLILKKQ